MKKALFAGVLAGLLWLVGCGNNALRYEKLHFEDEELAKNWVVESYEGVTAEVKEAVPDHLTAELYNGLEQDIVLLGWDGVYMEQDDGWYMVRPPKEVVSAAVDTSGEEESWLLDSVQAGGSQEFTLDFTEVYQGLTLPAGDYRIALSFDLSLLDDHDDRREIGKVWFDFTIS